ncbi:Carbohydrate-binding protein [Oryctes borbonicus]|uniref:Carbohydrate-binding protein n=1 Tax=Oryctes borbonicus TaxID=1629725 RepID=A0A0T6BC10_9SCAR|nr:Carbohydrate-binding protein [Oryctes borbonicus]
MRVVGLLIFIGLVAEWSGAQFLNNRPFPTYSLESMPDTDFTCRDKVLGGYYADPETQCQMFHVCVKVAGVGVQDFRFLCPNATAFDQDHQICAEWDDVDCDATTLYYSSDNFDLYRIGSGFESKAVKYGEEEETFALQRAETGDARINHEHQVQRVNQQKQLDVTNSPRRKPNYQYNNNDNGERDILKGSSSSSFFNNRNGGKDVDEDDDDRNVNYNQDRDQEQRRKISRQQVRKPQSDNYNSGRSNRPSGFLNNFAGSSYATSPKPISTTVAPVDQQSVARGRNGRPRSQYDNDRQYHNADNFRQGNGRNYDNDQNTYNNQASYTISTPAPFRQTQQLQLNNNNQNQYQSTTIAPKSFSANENYPSTFPQQKQSFQTKQTENYPSTYNQPRSSFPSSTTVQQKATFAQKETENYPSVFPKKQTSNQDQTTPLANNYEVTKVKQTQNYPSPSNTTPVKQTENYPTTFSPKTVKPTTFQNYPSTFSPRTNSAFTQISQQTTQQQKQQFTQNIQQTTQQQRQQFSQNSQQYNTQSAQFKATQITTAKPSPFTQYTPTIPKVSSTTPIIRSNRFDETQYDDGSYNPKYDNYENKDSSEEFLKTAHSTNIASSRNELAKAGKATAAQTTTAKPLYDSPRPFSVSANTPRATEIPKSSFNDAQNSQSTTNSGSTPTKKEKNASYDYAYYDSNSHNEHEYEIDTDFKKSSTKQQ